MGRQDLLEDKGTVYSKTGSALTTSYTFGDDVNPGHATRLSLFVIATEAAAASSMGNVLVKLQVKDSAGNYYDAITTRNDASGTTQLEHTIATTAGASAYVLLQTENIAASVAGFRVAGKADGATVTGDGLVVRAVVA